MPNYEYRCNSCENVFEIWQEVGSSPPPCPECGSEVKKVFHPVRTIFKGSGFYVTDLRAEKGGDKSAAGSASKTASASENKSESATDSKSETPAATPAKTDSAAPASTPPAAASPAKSDSKPN